MSNDKDKLLNTILPAVEKKYLYEVFGTEIGNSWNIVTQMNNEIAMLCMQIISEWSLIDAQLQQFFFSLLDENESFDEKLNEYAKLTQPDKKKEAFNRVVKNYQSKELTYIVNKFWNEYGNFTYIRNLLVHGVWGKLTSEKLQDLLILISTKDYIEFDLSLKLNSDNVRLHSEFQSITKKYCRLVEVNGLKKCLEYIKSVRSLLLDAIKINMNLKQST